MNSPIPKRLYQPPAVTSVRVFLPMLAATTLIIHRKKPYPPFH